MGSRHEDVINCPGRDSVASGWRMVCVNLWKSIFDCAEISYKSMIENGIFTLQ